MTLWPEPPSPRSTPELIVEAARSWVGTPFMHQQSLKGVGVDCVGVILGVGRELGILEISPEEWAPFAAYTRQPNPARMRKAMRRFLSESLVPAPRYRAGGLDRMVRLARGSSHAPGDRRRVRGAADDDSRLRAYGAVRREHDRRSLAPASRLLVEFSWS
jgi:hypothetical protein